MARDSEGRQRRPAWFRVEVAGDSMRPALADGDWLLCRRMAPGRPPRPGDVVVVEQPDRWGFLLVKRVVRQVDGGWWVQGDNEGATDDSRTFGAVPDDFVLARVMARLHPRPRRL